MIKKNKKILIGIGLILIIISGFLFLNREKQIPTTTLLEKSYSQEKIDKGIQIPSQKIKKIETLSQLENVKRIKVSLILKDKTYNTEIKEGSSVFETMLNIEKESTKENQFSFKYIENLGMGSFVNEINGVVGSPGAYWIYYVNGKEAGIGVSKYILKEGDIINWKQE